MELMTTGDFWNLSVFDFLMAYVANVPKLMGTLDCITSEIIFCCSLGYFGFQGMETPKLLRKGDGNNLFDIEACPRGKIVNTELKVICLQKNRLTRMVIFNSSLVLVSLLFHIDYI